MSNAGAAPSCDRHIVPVDLRDDWPSALTEAGYRRTEKTAWLAEGLLFYLPEASVTALLDAMAALSVAGSTLGTDTMSAATLGHPSRQAWVSYYASVGAPFIFGTDDPAELLARHGWRPTLHPYPDVAHEYGRSWLARHLQDPRTLSSQPPEIQSARRDRRPKRAIPWRPGRPRIILTASRNGGQLAAIADVRRRIGAGADPGAPAATP